MRSLVAVAFAAATLAGLSFTTAQAQEEITGAGSTFAYPVISHWSRGYMRDRYESQYDVGGSGLDEAPAGEALDYEPVGSLAGTMRVQDGRVDFAATDVPMKSEELAKLGLGQFPIVMGGVVAAFNIDGVGPGGIKLSGPVLADIFLGTVKKWNDPAIASLNPDVTLPDADIAVIHRSDGSGTTFNFADYLSKVSPAWKEQMGADTLLPWKVGAGAEGNSGLAAAIKQTKNSIGYVEYVQATQAGLSYALVRNSAGKFVKPEPATFQWAAKTADWANTNDFYLMLTNAPGDEAYPIAATVFVLMRKDSSLVQRPQATLRFLQWALEKGADDAAELGYVPLPPALVEQVKGYWAKNFKTGS